MGEGTAASTIEFDRCAGHISRALEYADGAYTLDDIRSGVEAGRLQLWPGVSSVIVTEILESPRQRTLLFFLAGGNLQELEAMLPPIFAWGRSQGCIRASLVGRAGWTRTFLARLGWKPTAVMMECSLDGEGR